MILLFVLGSLWMTRAVLGDTEFDSTISMVSTYLVTWIIMLILSFGTFALVIGI